MSVRVLVADDQELIRTGLRMILDAQPDIEVVGEAADGAQAVERLRALPADVVLMDVRMPRMDGIEATRRIATGGTAGPRVLILTTFDLDEYVFEAFTAGASGFLIKDAPREQIIEGIRAVAAGEALASPSVTRRLIERFVDSPGAAPKLPKELDELTPREREVLALMAEGRTNHAIAETLVVTEGAVKKHVSNIFGKLGLPPSDADHRRVLAVLAFLQG